MSEQATPVVLIIEDERDVAETYRLWLEGAYSVELATDGETGLERLDDSVDVVLLDRLMPGLSGGEVLEEIRDRDIDCRVAMVTAVEPDFDVVEMGFDAYLTKPVSEAELGETVETLLERSTYSELLQEYCSLVARQSTLEAEKSDRELAESEEYAELEERIERLDRQLADSLRLDDGADVVAAIRDLSAGEEE